MKVGPETIFGELLEQYPETEEVLRTYMKDAYCLTCPGKMFDTIGNGAQLHGLSPEQIQEMVTALQEVVDRSEKGKTKEN